MGHANAEAATDSFYSEIHQYNYERPGFSKATGHFTQLVWRATQRLGIAAAQCPNGSRVYVYHYQPQGNYIGRFPTNVLPPQEAQMPHRSSSPGNTGGGDSSCFCPQGHSMRRVATNGASLCDSCDTGHFEQGSSIYSCRTCDYELCISCASEQLFAAAAATSAGGGFKLYENCDSYGDDFDGCGPTWPCKEPHLQAVRQIAARAERMGAAAFNSIGCIKHSVRRKLSDVSSNNGWHGPGAGIYVRDSDVPRGWLFLPDTDSFGQDIVRYTGDCVFKAAREAEQRQAVAFNTWGYIKHSLDEIKPKRCQAMGGMRGLFVRI
ncbi:hypothetical protein HXX76_012867 [Chlamydomonas incerta]|uniref:SCP domain-containing protein n=1 Tax=Chlamydomonas incerta TaxID=51695 RepID=A0A835SR95_CHLIN|nr:hypothetical protein HXX76_012867 [Chlamydomonas incerta]|eukprot:KAG2426814.1 hypothetical protein HXX76_012867 [Chlamydomonas incerta]